MAALPHDQLLSRRLISGHDTWPMNFNLGWAARAEGVFGCLKVEPIENWSEDNWLCKIAEEAAGIVIKASDLYCVAYLPGFVTTLEMTSAKPR